MDAREHSTNFLLQTDPAMAIRKLGKGFIDKANSDDEILNRFKAIQERLNNTVLVTDPHFAMYERLSSAQTIYDLPTAPEWLRPLILVGYLNAKSMIASGRFARRSPDLRTALDRVLKMVDELEPDFLGELLVETVLTAREDRGFARTLRATESEFQALIDELYEPVAIGAAERPDDSGTVAMARRAPGGLGQSGDCTCCGSSGGTTRCEPCSCWIIVVIIIIIIVAK
jgi:hypothetical protein